jgi:aryl-alcohol dehydrogenase-like predicted oxidoreductase
MKYNRLGHRDLKVSEICIGCMTWGTQNTEAEGHAQMDYAVANGVNFFDVAEMYPVNPISAETQGRSEEIIGSWFKASGKRDQIILATKVTGEVKTSCGWRLSQITACPAKTCTPSSARI